MRCRSKYEQILFASKRTLESTERAAAYAAADIVVPVAVLFAPAFAFTLMAKPPTPGF
jgi:hypothetical protein